MPIQLITDAASNEGWQARVGRKGPGKTAYFAVGLHGFRVARRLAGQALARMLASHVRPVHWRKVRKP